MTSFILGSKQQSVIQQLHARRGRLIVMCSKGDASSVCPNESCRVVEVPQVEDCLQPVINVVPLQVYLQCIFIVFLSLQTLLDSAKGTSILVSDYITSLAIFI